MEKSQKTKLNFSAPLLSVRRINSVQLECIDNNNKNNTTETSQPVCVSKPECDSIEVTKPVAVPFCWEQAPGKRRICPFEDPSRRGAKDCAALEMMCSKGELNVKTREHFLETSIGKNEHCSNNVPYFSDYAEDVVTNESEDDQSSQRKRSHKFLKLFPRLFAKSSFGLLNPFPKIRSRGVKSSTNEVNRLARNTPSRPVNNARKAYSGPLEKQSYDKVYKQRFRSGAKSGELCRTDRRSGGISPYRNVNCSPRFNEGTRFLGVPREKVENNVKGGTFSSFRNVDSSPTDDVVEKTVYVDSVNYVKPPSSVLSSSVENRAGLDSESPKDLKGFSVRTYRNANASNRDQFKPDYRGICDVDSSLSPNYPPLPKMPSESWLRRTLPSVPSRGHADQINRSPRAANSAIKHEIYSQLLQQVPF